MSQDKIYGKCPCCKESTKFIELSFMENVSSLGGFIGGLLFGGPSAKVQGAKVLFNEFSDSRSFPNYKCCKCGEHVMQCSACKEIIPYAHDGSSHYCE